MKLTSCLTKDYENKPTSSNSEKQTQTKPIYGELACTEPVEVSNHQTQFAARGQIGNKKAGVRAGFLFVRVILPLPLVVLFFRLSWVGGLVNLLELLCGKMGVNLSSGEGLVAKQLLHAPQIGAVV